MFRIQLVRSDDSIGKFATRVPVFGVKREKVLRLKSYAFDPEYIADRVLSVELCGYLPCRCIAVERAHSFVVNGVVAHNSGGKESLEASIANLVGFIVKWSYPTGSKIDRWQPSAIQAEAGNVVIVDDGTWSPDEMVQEMHNSDGTNNTFDDYTDAFAAAMRGLGKAMTRAIW